VNYLGFPVFSEKGSSFLYFSQQIKYEARYSATEKSGFSHLGRLYFTLKCISLSIVAQWKVIMGILS